MQLGTVWNNCILIYYDGKLGGFPVHLEKKIVAEWEKYKQKYKYYENYNGWYDLDDKICFGGAQFRNSIAGKDHHFIDDEKDFLVGKWGNVFVEKVIKENKVFTTQDIVYDREGIYSTNASLRKFNGKSVLIVGGGPTTNAVRWQNLDYDYIWTCNKFYLNPEISECHVDLVVLARDVPLSNNDQFESYLQKHPTLMLFQLERGNNIDAWKEANTFVEKYPERCFFFHTRYHSRIGIGARLLCQAILLGLKDIYFVGIDGMTKDGPLHSFEPSKDNPRWYKIHGDALQKRQFVVWWDYIFSLKKQYNFNIYNLGEENSYNVSRNISKQECPLTDFIKRKIIFSDTKEVEQWSVATEQIKRSQADQSEISILIEALKNKDETVQRSAATKLGKLGFRAKDAVPLLITLLLEDSRVVRRASIAALANIAPHNKKVVSSLIAALQNPDETTQWYAADAIGKSAALDKKTFSSLIALSQDEKPLVRRYAIYTLGKIGKKAIPCLIAALQDTDAEVRWLAAEALGDIGYADKSVGLALVAAFKDDDKTLPWVAAKALGKINSSFSIPPLREALQDEDVKARQFAAFALGQIGAAAKRTVPPLIERLEDEDSKVRQLTAFALGQIGVSAKRAVPALIERLEDKAVTVRLTAVGALGKIAPNRQEVVSALIDSLKDNDENLRWEATQLLSKIGPFAQEAIPALIQNLQDKDERVRAITVEALRQIFYSPTTIGKINQLSFNVQELLPALIKNLQDKDKMVRRAAAEMLGQMGPNAQEAVPALIVALLDKSGTVNRIAAKSLRKVIPSSKEAAVAFTAVAREQEPTDSQFTISMLAQISPATPDAIPTLIAALQEKNKMVQYFAAYALSDIGKEAVPALIDALQEKSKRRIAANALGFMGPAAKGAVSALIATLKDDDQNARLSAVDALGNIGPDAGAAVPALLEMLEEKEEMIQQATAEALKKIKRSYRILDLATFHDIQYWVSKEFKKIITFFLHLHKL